MHVAIVGAGALGRVYGAALAHAGTRVTFVVRPERVAETHAFVAERVNHDRRRLALAHPIRSATIPDDADFVLVAVRVEQIDAALEAALRATVASIVTLTPLLPPHLDALESALGRRALVAQPGVVAYFAGDVVRFWLPRVAPTLVEPGEHGAGHAFAGALEAAALPARVDATVRTSNPATTVAFFPVALALDAGGGSADAVLADRALTALAFDALVETRALAHAIGHVAPWTDLLVKFLRPGSLRIGVAIAERAAPEAVRFVEVHLGSKIHAQHAKMGATIASMLADRAMPHSALDALLARAASR